MMFFMNDVTQLPTTGNYTITGDWESLHFGETENMILHNGAILFASTADDSNFDLPATLNAGDTIDFLVAEVNGNSGDSTGLRAELKLTTVPELSHMGLLAACLCFAARRSRSVRRN